MLSHRLHQLARQRTRETYRVTALIAEGQAEVAISRVFPLPNAVDDVAAVEDGHAENKVAAIVWI